MAEFSEWPSTARLFRKVTVTEKIDGTNAAVIFEPVDPDSLEIDETERYVPPANALRLIYDNPEHPVIAVYAQSRKRLINPSSDNAGFAKWVWQNADKLFYVLGTGRHYGEWWGQGIQRKYGMDRKVFSTFNTAAWYRMDEGIGSRYQRAYTTDLDIGVVPILGEFDFNEEDIRETAEQLFTNGSRATLPYLGKRFSEPEGICIYHKQADRVFKYTFDNNDRHKWEEAVLLDLPKRTLMDKILRRK